MISNYRVSKIKRIARTIYIGFLLTIAYGLPFLIFLVDKEGNLEIGGAIIGSIMVGSLISFCYPTQLILRMIDWFLPAECRVFQGRNISHNCSCSMHTQQYHNNSTASDYSTPIIHHRYEEPGFFKSVFSDTCSNSYSSSINNSSGFTDYTHDPIYSQMPGNISNTNFGSSNSNNGFSNHY